VEVLVQVRDLMAGDLAAQDKTEWAEQEFDALTRFNGPPVRLEPWRHTSGLHKVRNRRGAAMVRELWLTRDAIAAERDIAPGRILPNAALVDLALRAPKTDADLAPGGQGPAGRLARSVRKYQQQWLAALERARQLPETELPALTVRSDGPPPARAWAERDPVAAARLAQARAALGEFAQARHIPVENVISPDSLRRMLWTPPPDPTTVSISETLLGLGARQWQVDIAGPIIEEAINRPAAPTAPPTAPAAPDTAAASATRSVEGVTE
jgi:ribonuclease D